MREKSIDFRLIALLSVLLGGMGQGVVAPQMPQLLHGSTSLVLDSGLSATVMYFGVFLSTFFYGKWADQGKAHFLLILGLWSYALVLVALALHQSLYSLFILRFLEGLALSALFVAADFILGRLSPVAVRGQWLSYYGAALSIGLALGPLTSFLFQPLGTYRYPLFLVAFLALCTSFTGLKKCIPRADEKELKVKKWSLDPLLTGAIYGYMEASLVAIFPILAVREFHVSPEICLILMIFFAAMSSVGWGMLSDRAGASVVTRILLFLLFVGSALLLFASLVFASLVQVSPAFLQSERIAYAACILYGILAGGLYPVGFSWLLASVPESQYGQASGAFARAYGAGSLVGPLLTGWLAHSYQTTGLFLSLTGVGLAGCLMTSRRGACRRLRGSRS